MSLVRIAAVVAIIAVAGVSTVAAQGTDRPQISRTPHRTLNKENCLSCHGIGANEHVSDVPATDHDFTNATCLRCHRLAATMPSRSQHPFDAAHARCAACHFAGNTVGAQPTPATTHARYHTSTCVMCHEPQQP